MNIQLPKMQAYCRLDGKIYDVNEVHLNETPQLVALNKIEAFETTYFPISGKYCEVFLIKEFDNFLEEIYGKTLFEFDIVAYSETIPAREKGVSYSETVMETYIEHAVIRLVNSCDFFLNYSNCKNQAREIILKLNEKSDEYFKLLKNTENYKEKCIKIGNLFDYLDQATINQLFEIIRK